MDQTPARERLPDPLTGPRRDPTVNRDEPDTMAHPMQRHTTRMPVRRQVVTDGGRPCLWRDEQGAVVSSELILMATVMVIGTLVGLVTYRNAIVQEMADVAAAVSQLNQSYQYDSITMAGSFNGVDYDLTLAGSVYVDQADAGVPADVDPVGSAALGIDLTVDPTEEGEPLGGGWGGGGGGGGNNPPVAGDDDHTTDYGTDLNVPGPGVLDNDSDPDLDPLTVVGHDNPSANGGTVVVNPDGSFSYSPPSGFSGTDTFDYTIDDGNGGTATGTVTVVVNPSVPPTAVNDAASTVRHVDIVIDILGNDSSAGGAPLNPASVVLSAAPSLMARLSLNPVTGAVTYDATGTTGTFTFTYTVQNTLGQTSNSATVTIVVTP